MYLQSNLYSYILNKCIKNTEYEDYKINPYLFIVVNKSSLSPMVWKDNLNFHIGDLKTDYGIIWDWRPIAKELWNYLNNGIPNYPVWKEPENDLHKFLNTDEWNFEGKSPKQE